MPTQDPRARPPQKKIGDPGSDEQKICDPGRDEKKIGDPGRDENIFEGFFEVWLK